MPFTKNNFVKFTIKDCNGVVYYHVSPDTSIYNCFKCHCQRHNYDINRTHMFYIDKEIDITRSIGELNIQDGSAI